MIFWSCGTLTVTLYRQDYKKNMLKCKEQADYWNIPVNIEGEERNMYENFILQQFENGKLEGYSWKLENPEKVICIVHGIGEFGGRFDRVAEAFRENNMAVLAFDLRGHGHSLGKRGHCAPRKDVLSDVSTLIEYAKELYPEKKLILYGHSMGGNIVLDYRSRGRLNGVPAAYIVTAPWVRLVRPVPNALYKVVKLLSRIAPSFTIGSAVNEADLGNLEKVRPYNDHPLVHNRISALCAVDGFETGRKLESGSLANNGRAKQIPLLLMHGEKDKICDVTGSRNIAARMKADGENVEYVEWEGLYHEIHNGGPQSKGDEVIEKAVKWAQKI